MQCYPCRATGLGVHSTLCPICDGSGVLPPVVERTIPRQPPRDRRGRFISPYRRVVVDGGALPTPRPARDAASPGRSRSCASPP